MVGRNGALRAGDAQLVLCVRRVPVRQPPERAPQLDRLT